MKTIGQRVLTIVLVLPALLFIVMGLRWLVDPAGVAPGLGVTLETGLGLSSQIGDLSSFFLVAGLSLLIALVTKGAPGITLLRCYWGWRLWVESSHGRFMMLPLRRRSCLKWLWRYSCLSVHGFCLSQNDN